MAPRILRSKWLFHLGVTGAFVGLVLWRVDVGGALGPLADANYLWVPPALLLFSLAKFIDAARWQVLLAKVRVLPLSSLFGAFLVGNVVNNLLPLRAGDIAKIQILANRFGVSRAGLTASVFAVEAVLDGVTFLVFLLLGLALWEGTDVPAVLLWGLASIAILGLALTLVASRLQLPADLSTRPWARFLPARLRGGIGDIWPQFRAGLAAMRDSRLAVKALALSFPAWLVEAAMFWMFGLAFGLDLSFGAYMAIMIAANLAVMLPLALWNIGPYEVVLLELLVAWGVERDLAFAYALATHVLTNLWIVATGLLAIWLMRISLADVFTVRTPPTPAEVSRADATASPVLRESYE